MKNGVVRAVSPRYEKHVNDMVALIKSLVPVKRGVPHVNEDAHITHMAIITLHGLPISVVCFYLNKDLRSVHFSYAATSPLGQGKGLSVLLWTMIIKYAASLGYRIATTEAVSVASQQLVLKKLGFKPLTKPYVYKADKGMPYAGIHVFKYNNIQTLPSMIQHFSHVSPPFTRKYLKDIDTLRTRMISKLEHPLSSTSFRSSRPSLRVIAPESMQSFLQPESFSPASISAAGLVRSHGYTYKNLQTKPKTSPRRLRRR
jgi:GNAT superfamily N-acetyltransferase